jgi:hypothetical protein
MAKRSRGERGKELFGQCKMIFNIKIEFLSPEDNKNYKDKAVYDF